MTPKEFAQKWFKTMDAGNYVGLKALLAEHHQFRNPASEQPLSKEEHIGMIQQMMGALTGNHQIEQMISEGDWILIRGRWKGKHTGAYNGIPASGHDVDFTFMDVMHVVNDKLVEEHMEWNAMRLQSQIGIHQPA